MQLFGMASYFGAILWHLIRFIKLAVITFLGDEQFTLPLDWLCFTS